MQDLIGRTLGHYRIVEKIGEGGRRMDFSAENTVLSSETALDFLFAYEGDIHRPTAAVIRTRQNGSAYFRWFETLFESR